jgi:hypothetical protein
MTSQAVFKFSSQIKAYSTSIKRILVYGILFYTLFEQPPVVDIYILPERFGSPANVLSS